MTIIIVTAVLGLLLLLTELVLLPGITVAGIGAAVSFGVSVWYGYELYGLDGALYILAVVVALAAVLVWVSLRSRTWKKMSLDEAVDSTVETENKTAELAVGDRGVAMTRLAPMGNVMINGRIVEAKSLDSYIDPKQEIVVVRVSGSEIVVTKA